MKDTEKELDAQGNERDKIDFLAGMEALGTSIVEGLNARMDGLFEHIGGLMNIPAAVCYNLLHRGGGEMALDVADIAAPSELAAAAITQEPKPLVLSAASLGEIEDIKALGGGKMAMADVSWDSLGTGARHGVDGANKVAARADAVEMA